MKHVLTIFIALLMGNTLIYAQKNSLETVKLASSSDIANWTVRRDTHYIKATWPDNHPGECGKLDFDQYKKGGAKWPAIVWKKPALKNTNWELLTKLNMQIFAMEGGFIRLHIVSYRNGKRLGFSYDISLKKGRNLIEVSSANLGSVHLSDVREIHFFLTCPTKKQTFYIGDVFGSFEDPQIKLTAFKSRCKTVLEKNISSLSEDDKRIFNEKKRQIISILKTLDKKELTPAKNLSTLYDKGEILLQELTSLAQLSEFMKLKRSPELAVAWVSSSEKVFKDNQIFQKNPKATCQVSLARNEREGAQLVLFPLQKLNNVRIKVKKLPEDNKGNKLSGGVRIDPVGYVLCKKPSYPVSRTGFFPDPILEYAQSMDLESKKYQAYYLDVMTESGTPKGNYNGSLELTADGISPIELPFSVRVYNFSLPDGTPYSLATSKGATSLGPHRAVHELPPARKAYHQKCMDFYLKYRLSPDNVYRWHPPKVKEALKIVKNKGGMFNIIYIRPLKADKNGKFPEPERTRILNALKQMVPKYQKANILKHAYIYAYDEAGSDKFAVMKDILGTIKKLYPSIPIMTTAYDYSYGIDSGLDHCVDIWVSLSDKIPVNTAAIEKARKKGHQVWWYYCIAPRSPYPNFMIEYPLIDGRLIMGMMCWKYQSQGFLYYSMAMWRKYEKRANGSWKVSMREKPMTGAPYTDWAGYSWRDSNGDGNWLYPATSGPIPSLRLKNIVDGMEDFFYLKMLNDAVSAVERGQVKVSVKWLEKAKVAIKCPDRLVSSLMDFSHSSFNLKKERDNVAVLLEQQMEAQQNN